MNEKGIPKPPERPLTKDTWIDWWRWFGRVWANFPKVQTFTATLNPASVAANTVARQTFTVAGLTTTDVITVNPPSLTTGLNLIGFRVSAADTVELTFWNSTGSPIDPASEAYLIVAIRR